MVRSVSSGNRKLLGSADTKEDLKGAGREQAVLEPGDAFSCWGVTSQVSFEELKGGLCGARDKMGLLWEWHRHRARVPRRLRLAVESRGVALPE